MPPRESCADPRCRARVGCPLPTAGTVQAPGCAAHVMLGPGAAAAAGIRAEGAEHGGPSAASHGCSRTESHRQAARLCWSIQNFLCVRRLPVQKYKKKLQQKSLRQRCPPASCDCVLGRLGGCFSASPRPDRQHRCCVPRPSAAPGGGPALSCAQRLPASRRQERLSGPGLPGAGFGPRALIAGHPPTTHTHTGPGLRAAGPLRAAADGRPGPLAVGTRSGSAGRGARGASGFSSCHRGTAAGLWAPAAPQRGSRAPGLLGLLTAAGCQPLGPAGGRWRWRLHAARARVRSSVSTCPLWTGHLPVFEKSGPVPRGS